MNIVQILQTKEHILFVLSLISERLPHDGLIIDQLSPHLKLEKLSESTDRHQAAHLHPNCEVLVLLLSNIHNLRNRCKKRSDTRNLRELGSELSPGGAFKDGRPFACETRRFQNNQRDVTF